jgi:predicted transposase YdaD
MLEETLIEWREKIRREGHREGRKEGRLEERRKVLLEQMTLRFGRLPKEVRGQVEQITSTQKLHSLTKKILSAKTLHDLGLG